MEILGISNVPIKLPKLGRLRRIYRDGEDSRGIGISEIGGGISQELNL